MDMLRFLVDDLSDPWRTEIRSLLVDPCPNNKIGDLVMTYGISAMTRDNILQGHRLRFEPFCGLVGGDEMVFIESEGFQIPNIPRGSTFGVADAKLVSTEPLRLRLLEQSQIWIVPEFIKDWQPSFCHIFSGAFEGWSRSIEWMRHQFGIGCLQSISLDHDEDVMRIWSIRNNMPYEKPPFRVDGRKDEPITGVLANVREHSWINKCHCLTNLWFTISPPCISWSLGGRAAGLQHDAGMAFIFAIEKIQKVRPIGICGECADVTPKHPHCKILKALMTYAGYRMIWDSVEPLHFLSPMVRQRWLFVWIRNDVLCTDIPKTILLKEQPVTSWNDEMYRFFIPDQISHQMKLGNRLLDIYGDAALLPSSKRNNLPKNFMRDDILRARCPDPKLPLPTLCASYTSQHLLSENHLAAKGIFAFLGSSAGEFHFLDPFRFCALFGSPDSQILVIPTKLPIAFKQIGNAIAVPHALATILVAMNAVGSWNFQIHDTVQKCWNQRIRASHCLLVRSEDFVCVLPVPVVLVCFSRLVCPKVVSYPHLHDVKFFVNFTHDNTTWDVAPHSSIENFLSRIGIEKPSQQFAKCSCDQISIPWSTALSTCVGKCIQVHLQDEVSLNFKVGASVEPTQPWTPDDQSLREAVISAETQDPVYQNAIVFCVAEDKPIIASIQIGSSDEQISKQLDALCNPKNLYREPCWIECCRHPFQPEYKRCFLVDYHEIQDTDVKYFLLVDQNGKGKAAFIHGCQPICVLLNNLGLITVDIEWNGCNVNSHLDIQVADGDVISLHSSQIDNRSRVEQTLNERINHFNEQSEKAAVDEFTFALDVLRSKSKGIFINRVVDLTVVSSAADIITHLHWAFDGIDHDVVLQGICFFPFLLDNHWCAIETSFENQLSINCIGVPEHLIHPFIGTFAKRFDFDGRLVQRKFLPLVGMNGLCGWTLLKRWFKKANVPVPIVRSQTRDLVSKAHFEEFLLQQQLQSGYDTFCSICEFAISIRAFFICHLRLSPSRFLSSDTKPKFGAGTEDVKMDHQEANRVDPWLRHDPWLSKDKPKQCKWEDLKLPNAHPFVSKDQKPIQQVHRQKLTPHAGGIAFTTKTQVQALLKLNPAEPAAVLIPAIDSTFFDTLQPKPVVSGPHEVIVIDSGNDDTYKRQVWMIELTKGITFHLPKPSYQAKLQEVCEIVFEVDSRLISKELNQGFLEKPHDHFKAKIADQVATDVLSRVNLYAYRKFSPKGADPSHIVHQIMCKIPADKRAVILDKSGVGCIFIRDYIAKGEKQEDITVIPKFWEITKQSKDEAVRATCGLNGFAGLMISKRGLAARAWTSSIATLRRALLPLDDRLSELNLSVVPRIIRDSTGWPASISPQEIIRATHHALSLAPVPSRCFRSNGVTCWTLAFEKEPSQTTFVAQFNDKVYEILLTVPGFKKNPKENNGSTKPKKPAVVKDQDVNQLQNDQINDRVSMLEAKFGNLERRQDVVEHKLTSGFDQVQDQLRQILNAVGGRSDKSPTGSTPPPKFPKTA